MKTPSWNLLREPGRYANAASHSDPEQFRERLKGYSATLARDTARGHTHSHTKVRQTGETVTELRAVTRIGK